MEICCVGTRFLGGMKNLNKKFILSGPAIATALSIGLEHNALLCKCINISAPLTLWKC